MQVHFLACLPGHHQSAVLTAMLRNAGMPQMLSATAVQALCLAHLEGPRACEVVLLPARQAWTQQQLQQQAAVYLWSGTQAHQAEGQRQNTPGMF
jgi:hypothetical protein